MASTRSNESSGNGSVVASPNMHGSPCSRQSSPSASSGRSSADERHAGEALAQPRHHVPLADADLQDPPRREAGEHLVEGAA